MKLRIRGNSIRLRVTRSELDQVASAGMVEDSIAFGPETSLTYRLEVNDGAEPSAELDSRRIRVTIPRARLPSWLEEGEVSIRGEQPLGGRDSLSILVEKDFECLNPRADEDASELFAHPEKTPP